jgi:hypothetical protein
MPNVWSDLPYLFISSVRQSGKYDGKIDPWPPFRIPGKPHPELASMSRLLHSKTLHGVIFTTLYKVNKDGITTGFPNPQSALFWKKKTAIHIQERFSNASSLTN